MISVVIPVRNGAATLASQLKALEVALDGISDAEVVVSDNGSTDNTREIAEGFATRLPIRVIDSSRSPGPNVARNEGVRASTGDRILLCDADDEVAPEWVAAMIEAFDRGCQLVAGPIDYVRLNDSTTRRWRGTDRASVHMALGFLPAGHGADLGFTRVAFDTIGGFDESYRYGGEDVEFCWRAQLAGFELHEVPDAVVNYRLRPGLESLWHQFHSYAVAEARLARGFRQQGVKRRRVRAPLYDAWWLVSRAPFVIDLGRRGAWIRRLAVFVGRFRGAIQHRVIWW